MTGDELVAVSAVGATAIGVAATLGGLVLAGMNGLRRQMTELRIEVRADIADLRGEVGDLRNEVHRDIGDLRERVARIEGLMSAGERARPPAPATSADE